MSATLVGNAMDHSARQSDAAAVPHGADKSAAADKQHLSAPVVDRSSQLVWSLLSMLLLLFTSFLQTTTAFELVKRLVLVTSTFLLFSSWCECSELEAGGQKQSALLDVVAVKKRKLQEVAARLEAEQRSLHELQLNVAALQSQADQLPLLKEQELQARQHLRSMRATAGSLAQKTRRLQAWKRKVRTLRKECDVLQRLQGAAQVLHAANQQGAKVHAHYAALQVEHKQLHAVHEQLAAMQAEVAELPGLEADLQALVEARARRKRVQGLIAALSAVDPASGSPSEGSQLVDLSTTHRPVAAKGASAPGATPSCAFLSPAASPATADSSKPSTTPFSTPEQAGCISPLLCVLSGVAHDATTTQPTMADMAFPVVASSKSTFSNMEVSQSTLTHLAALDAQLTVSPTPAAGAARLASNPAARCTEVTVTSLPIIAATLTSPAAAPYMIFTVTPAPAPVMTSLVSKTPASTQEGVCDSPSSAVSSRSSAPANRPRTRALSRAASLCGSDAPRIGAMGRSSSAPRPAASVPACTTPFQATAESDSAGVALSSIGRLEHMPLQNPSFSSSASDLLRSTSLGCTTPPLEALHFAALGRADSTPLQVFHTPAAAAASDEFATSQWVVERASSVPNDSAVTLEGSTSTIPTVLSATGAAAWLGRLSPAALPLPLPPPALSAQPSISGCSRSMMGSMPSIMWLQQQKLVSRFVGRRSSATAPPAAAANANPPSASLAEKDSAEVALQQVPLQHLQQQRFTGASQHLNCQGQLIAMHETQLPSSMPPLIPELSESSTVSSICAAEPCHSPDSAQSQSYLQRQLAAVAAEASAVSAQAKQGVAKGKGVETMLLFDNTEARMADQGKVREESRFGLGQRRTAVLNVLYDYE